MIEVQSLVIGIRRDRYIYPLYPFIKKGLASKRRPLLYRPSSARDRKTERIVYPPFRRIWMKTKEVRLGKQSAVPNNLVFNTAFARVLHAHAKMPVTLVAGKPTIESIEGVRTCKIRPKSAIKSPPYVVSVSVSGWGPY